MSVLKSKRKESTIEFVFNAYKIYILTIEFISRLSARYSRLMASDITHLAFEVLRKAYFKKYNDHNRILKLRRLFYYLFDFSCESMKKFQYKQRQLDEIYCT